MISINELALGVGKKIELSQTELNWTTEHGFISFITDCEGDWHKFHYQKERNENLIQGLKNHYPQLALAKTTVIYGGDATDKGKGNIGILLELRKLRLQGNSLFIAGNRDANKIRLIEALSPKLRETFSTIDSEYAFWTTNAKPKSWVDEHNKKGIDSPLYRKYRVSTWDELNPIQKHLAILSFIFEKTMGAPTYLDDLKEELLSNSWLNRNSTEQDLINAIYELHFSKELCDTFRLNDWLPQLETIQKNNPTLQGLQSEYVEHATLGMVIGGVIFEHSLAQVFPRKQDGTDIGWFTRHQAKIKLISAIALGLMTIATMSQLLAFSFVAAMAITTIGAAVALFLAYDAYKTSQKSLVSRWFEVRNAELAQHKKSYLDIATQNPDDLFDWSETPESLLKPHPYICAGLGQTEQINRTIPSEQTCLKDVIILTNSTNQPITEEYAKLLQDNGAKALVYGHQPAALPLLHKSSSGFWTAGCDVIGKAIGGGVVAGANLFSTEHLQDRDGCMHVHTVTSKSDEMYGQRVEHNKAGDIRIQTTSKLSMVVNTKNNFFADKGIINQENNETYEVISREQLDL